MSDNDKQVTISNLNEAMRLIEQAIDTVSDQQRETLLLLARRRLHLVTVALLD